MSSRPLNCKIARWNRNKQKKRNLYLEKRSIVALFTDVPGLLLSIYKNIIFFKQW